MSHVGRNKRTLVVALMLSAGLAACGGGGAVMEVGVGTHRELPVRP